MGHSRNDDSVDHDQTPDSPQSDGHDFVEHSDGTSDDEEGE
jgi:hypothetical protein